MIADNDHRDSVPRIVLHVQDFALARYELFEGRAGCNAKYQHKRFASPYIGLPTRNVVILMARVTDMDLGDVIINSAFCAGDVLTIIISDVV
jgi:hypothetical protein